MSNYSKIPTSHPPIGTSYEEEAAHLKEVLAIADKNLKKTKASIKKYKDELYDLLETYGTKDHEALALWHNTQSLMLESERDLVRVEKARKKPYFGRIDFKEDSKSPLESYYIGRVGISRTPSDPEVIDWRAPIASVYYESRLGKCHYHVKNEATYEIDLSRKRTYEIANDKLVDFFDSDVVANDDLLTKYLAKSKRAVLGEIIATIQQEQNAIIRSSPRNNMIVQGVAGSGKTTVAMHRISYILYNYEEDFKPEDFYIIGSNRILLNYITSVLPDLDVYGIRQMTMEQLFTRLLYEDWDDRRYRIRQLDKNDASIAIKGTRDWYMDLENFCLEYEKSCIPAKDVRIHKNNHLLIGPNVIETYLSSNPLMSMQSKILMLNEILLSKLENEIQGKEVSYTAVEKKKLLSFYEHYFGKDDWNGSVFQLYTEFLQYQAANGKSVEIPVDEFDVYDLAALAYLYKRIKETDPIREATHIVIDEAQDFGMMAYSCLHYCIRGCTYTIMGDVSQNIHYGYGLNDWEQLKELILSGPYDSFGLLKKSYRNTVEISNFATDILQHGNFPIYPVEPIIRHGSNVELATCDDENALLQKTVLTVKDWLQNGHETIAIITRDESDAQKLHKLLSPHLPLIDSNLETTEFGTGVMILPVAYTKGLEFDAVLLYQPDSTAYPADDGHVKLLYVAATRALHELTVLYTKDLSPLIATKADPKKHMALLASEEARRPVAAFEEEKSQEQIHLEQITEGAKDMSERHYIGPKRIVVQTEDLEKQKKYIIKKKITSAESDVEKALNNYHQKKQASPSASKATKADVSSSNAPINGSPFAFGSMPDNNDLKVPGHAKSDMTIRWIKKTKTYVDLASSYGVLRVEPVKDALILVRFHKGQTSEFSSLYEGFCPDYVLQDKKITGIGISKDSTLTWNAKESREAVEIRTNALLIRCEKKTGALSFFYKNGNLLLAEKAQEARYICDAAKGAYSFFDWAKNEKLDAIDVLPTELMRVTLKSRYISFGQKQLRMPWITSDRGYRLGFAADDAVLFCGIPMYGPYVYCANALENAYYFAVKE